MGRVGLVPQYGRRMWRSCREDVTGRGGGWFFSLCSGQNKMNDRHVGGFKARTEEGESGKGADAVQALLAAAFRSMRGTRVPMYGATDTYLSTYHTDMPIW